MKKACITIYISCAIGLSSIGQSLAKIKSLILKADSVILTSHSYPGMFISEKEEPDDRKLILNGKINPKLIIEQKRLTTTAVKYLASCITRPFADKKIIEDQCFNPRHTVYIFRDKTVSYIDICFECREIECSNDIIFPINDFDSVTWKKLEKFFHAQGFKYGFDIKNPE